MSKRILILALLLIAGLTTLALADGGFYGNITYHDCSCYHHPTLGDMVYIQSTGGGQQYQFNVGNCSYNPSYSTGTTSFPTGYYNIWVVLHNGSDCNMGYVQTVYHDGSASDQEVGLRVEKTPPPGQ
jgi:hypothetical protein